MVTYSTPQNPLAAWMDQNWSHFLVIVIVIAVAVGVGVALGRRHHA